MFEKMKNPLFIFEMANNHMGDVDHGIKIINAFKAVAGKYKILTLPSNCSFGINPSFTPITGTEWTSST
jgi:hypothetical protein